MTIKEYIKEYIEGEPLTTETIEFAIRDYLDKSEIIADAYYRGFNDYDEVDHNYDPSDQAEALERVYLPEYLDNLEL